MLKKYKIYIISIAIPVIVGLLAAFLTMENMNIYQEVQTPPLSPPSWLFPIVWTILYILMGISSGIIYLNTTATDTCKKNALSIYTLQLIFNFFWSIFFFNYNAFLFSFIWLLILLLLILLMINKFFSIEPLAGKLQIPYAIWVAFAGYLNFFIYLLNR